MYVPKMTIHSMQMLLPRHFVHRLTNTQPISFLNKSHYASIRKMYPANTFNERLVLADA